MKVMCLLAFLLLAGADAAAQDMPRFEAAVVRPNHSVGESGSMSNLTGSRFTTVNVPLHILILDAFEIREQQLVNAPDWIRTARFDISAVFPEGTQPVSERRRMLQNLLADRFGLVARRETQEAPIYRLVMARDDRKPGPNLVRSDVDCAKWFAEGRSQIIGQGRIGPGGAKPACLMVAQRNYLLAGTQSMERLAKALESRVQRQVVDATGLTGNFDMDLQWNPDPATTDDVSLFTALQEQLGLKLEAARSAIDVLVIEAVTRPTSD